MAPHEPPNGTPGRWEAPSSTMAAQLINNLSTKKPSRQIEHDDLQSLMTEVSSRENDPSDFPDSEAMLDHKHKLSYVIARVVLEKVNKNDPFMNVQNVVDQACEALDVLILTVKDVPNILDYKLNPNHPLKTRGPEPFWIWLFPRVLSCLGRRNCKKLTAKVEMFLSTSFEIIARSPKLWGSNSSFFVYLKESVSSKCTCKHAPLDKRLHFAAILNTLQNLNLITHCEALDFELPSDQVNLSALCSDVEEDHSLSYLSCTYKLHDAACAIQHAICLLCILVNLSTKSTQFQDSTTAFQDYLAWMLDSFHSSYDLQKVWISPGAFSQDRELVTITLFSSLHALLSLTRTSSSDSLIRKGYAYLALIAGDFITAPFNVTDKDTNLILCQGLLGLANACRKYDSTSRTVRLSLLPKLRAVIENKDTSIAVGSDFQVCNLVLRRAPS